MKKYTKEELLQLTENFGEGNELGEHAWEWANDYEYESDTLDTEETVHDAVIEGVRWAIAHLK